MAKRQPVGRPTKYDKHFHCKDLLVGMKNGLCVVEVCSKWEISKDTFYEWVKVHKEFSDHYKQAKAHLEAWYCQLFKAQAVGKVKGNPASAIWLSKQVLDWSEKWSVRENNDVEFIVEE